MSGVHNSTAPVAQLPGPIDTNTIIPIIHSYVSVSRTDATRNPVNQCRLLSDYGIREDLFFAGVASGRTMKRTDWQELMDRSRPTIPSSSFLRWHQKSQINGKNLAGSFNILPARHPDLLPSASLSRSAVLPER